MEFEVVVAFELVVVADGGEDFGLFDGVDAEVGFEVEFGVEEVGWVAGHVGDDGGDGGQDRVAVVTGCLCRHGRGRCRGCGFGFGFGFGGAGALVDPAGDVVEGGEVVEFEVVVAFELVVGAYGGEDFGLFDGVDAEVGFEVEFGVEEVGWVAGHVGDDGGDGGQDRVAVVTGCLAG